MDTGKAFALKFISGKYQGGELPLSPGKEVRIGRSSELEIVLVEEMVSRKHARLFTDEDGPVLSDLGSTNGTFVNGERVSETRLKEGDRFLIGTSIFKVVTMDPGSIPLDQSEIRERLEEVAAAKPRSGGAMNGRIDEVSIPDLLQLFQASKKSGVLRLTDGSREAMVHLRKGRIVFAEIVGKEHVDPLRSIYRIIAWTTGDFELAPAEEREFPAELEESTEAILMEGSRRLDELRLHALPPSGDRIVFVEPLEPLLRDLTPDELDVLQLVVNQGELDAILDHSTVGDLETAAHLASLIERGYARAL
ncbi:DUF4388 domain-containing protein [Vulgatibacter incomptus]|uniref:FHA domain protein n=1 Tax=Vulgatibacter incomptus TaxID=1391653 RepID=A0A0K1PAU3_9BACT|nr:DUF4388 domain-containing protein [Vulgatibacter incomptus]AKU90219.1 FHA domain protein [Vulgatibacter incomptus]